MDLWVIFRLACSLEYAATAPQRGNEAFKAGLDQHPALENKPLEYCEGKSREL